MAAWPSNRGKPASGALSGNIDADTVAATVGQLRATAIAEERAEQMTRILARLEDGLYLRLNVLLRSAHWTFRYTSQAHGRRHDLGLGGYPRVSVQTARARWNATTPHCRTWRFRASYSRCATSRGSASRRAWR